MLFGVVRRFDVAVSITFKGKMTALCFHLFIIICTNDESVIFALNDVCNIGMSGKFTLSKHVCCKLQYFTSLHVQVYTWTAYVTYAFMFL